MVKKSGKSVSQESGKSMEDKSVDA